MFTFFQFFPKIKITNNPTLIKTSDGSRVELTSLVVKNSRSVP
jgi:hypothetical protein